MKHVRLKGRRGAKATTTLRVVPTYVLPTVKGHEPQPVLNVSV